jgi:hypothetical protein
MKNLFAYAVVAAAFFVAPHAAFAGENVADRTAAIQLCRAEVASQAGVEADTVRLDQVALRPRVVRVDFDLWRDGNLQNIRCEVSRGGGELQIASITPALQTAAVAR